MLNDFRVTIVLFSLFAFRFNMTPEEENHWRLASILYNDVLSKLRDFFKAKFQQRFTFAWGDNQMSGEFFIANANISHTDQFILNLIRQGDTAHFDATTLFWCLLYSGIDILQPKARRSHARSPPIRDRERIDELREMRNRVAHTGSATLSGAAFSQQLTSLEDIYVQLQWDRRTMRQIAQGPVVTEECRRLQQELEAERQRYRAHDLTLQDHEQRLQAHDWILQDHEQILQEHEGMSI